MFCPFVKGECVCDCIFKEYDDSCNILKTISKIERNTSTDQTESWYINSKMDAISEKLDKITAEIEQLAD